MKRSHIIISILLFVLGALCYIFFEALHTEILADELANKFLCGFISRFGLSLLFAWLLYMFGGRSFLLFSKQFFISLAWSLPCFMVALVNFPYSGLINKTVVFDRLDLLGLYALYIFGICLIEELVFRGVLLILVKDIFKNAKHAPIFVTIMTAAIFSLFHLTNLFRGGGIGDVLLQCLYTFLIGAMLTITMLKLNNIWLCVLIHAIFNFGGMLLAEGMISGNNWDVVFWVLTITSGVLCAGHVIYSLIKLDKNYVSNS